MSSPTLMHCRPSRCSSSERKFGPEPNRGRAGGELASQTGFGSNPLPQREAQRMFPALIDCDVHEDVPGAEAILPYLSDAWREFASLAGVMLAEGTTSFSMNPWGYHRKDSVPPGGGAPGSSLEFVVEQLLDPCEITYAVLTGDWMSL